MKNETESKIALKTITIGSFWEHYPKIYILKTVVQIVLELAFLGFATYVIVDEHNHNDHANCEGKVFGPWVLRGAVVELGLIHIVNIVRNGFKLSLRVKTKKQKVKAGVLKCLLLDCYCCLASTGWAFAQVCFFLK